MGWRYLYITLGGLCVIMSLIRGLVIRSRESPKWLVSMGRVDEAIDVLNNISDVNKSDHRVSAANFGPAAFHIHGSISFQENARRALNLFRGPKQLRLMLCLIGLWVLVGIT